MTGSHQHCLQALRTYGIPKESLPVNHDGTSVDNSLFQLHMEQHRKTELQSRSIAAAASNVPSILPGKADVLLGRGRPYQEHPGNLGFTCLIDDYREEYAARAKSRKSGITNRILEIVKRSGGRFLKKSKKEDGDEWIVVSIDEAREKVSHGFRAKSSRRLSDKNTYASRGRGGNPANASRF
jgi:hypothetical protein